MRNDGRMKKILHLFVLPFFLAFSFSLAFLHGGHAVIFNPKEFTLENGMRCIVIEDKTRPAIFHSLWVQVGGADEKMGKSGKAHFLEHMMFRGTEKLAPGQYHKIIHRLGGEYNAFTSQDITVYYVKIDKEHLESLMEMEADRLTGLKITDDVFIPEKKVIVEERQTRVDNEPGGLLYEQMLAGLYMHHPYRIPVIGWMQEIKDLSRDDLMAFYKQYYQPNNTILIVAGDVTMDEVKKLAEKHYGPLKSSDVKRIKRLQEPPAWSEKKISLEHSQVRQPQMMRIYRAPTYKENRGVKVASCEVLAEILGGGQSSILYDHLVVKNKQALGVECSYHNQYKDEANFILSAIPTPSIDPILLEASVDQILKNLLAKGINDEELTRVKKKLDAESVYARDSLNKGAMAIGYTLSVGGTIDDVENWNKHLDAVTKESVLEAAKDVFNPAKSITGYLRPKVS